MPDNPSQPEFYHRRVYGIGGFCVTNDSCARAFRDWDPVTGLFGLVSALRRHHQPSGDGTDMQIADIAAQMISWASEHGHLRPVHGVWAK